MFFLLNIILLASEVDESLFGSGLVFLFFLDEALSLLGTRV